MRAVVTGAAGFIGSHLSEALTSDGHTVLGVDCFTEYYDRRRKEGNLTALRERDNFSLVEADLGTAELAPILDGADVVFHQAAQPGVRLSWSEGFNVYAAHNILGTQRLLEAIRGTSVQRLVYASSSSVYGNAPRYPTTEDDLPRPFSPYGVTKLAAEHLCNLYAANYGTPTVSLRYFTVYGPRQRPDMAFHRFIEAALAGHELPLFGDGSQIRDFTYVGDVVAANVLAGEMDVPPGTVLNVCGGGSVNMTEVIETMSDIIGRPLTTEDLPEQPGDVTRTGGTSERARQLLGWSPATTLREGLERQVAWHRDTAA